MQLDAPASEIRLFAKGPLEVADASHKSLPLHVQNPPVRFLSWVKADEIVKTAAFPAEERIWRTFCDFYRSQHAADWLWANRDESKDVDPSRGSALLPGDIETLVEVHFATKVGPLNKLPPGCVVNCFVFTVLELIKGRRRIIAWPRATNVAERRLLDLFKAIHCVTPFPVVETLRNRVLYKYAAHVDLTKFFQQFELLTRRRFCFAHDGYAYELSTIPTGAVSPPILAQILLRACVSLAIRDSGTANVVVFDTMIDNARLCSDDWDALSAAWSRLMGLLNELGSTVGDSLPPAESEGRYEFLGIAFDHISRTVAVSSKFAAKLERATSLLKEPRDFVVADILSIFGATVWAAQVLGRPLAELYGIFKFIRRVSKDLANGGKLLETRKVWPCITSLWIDWMIGAAQAATEIVAPDGTLPRLIAFSDASDTGWGAIVFDGDRISVLAGDWSDAERKLHINQKEFLTIKKMLLTFSCDPAPEPRPMDLYVDNTTAQSWGNKKNPSGYVPAQLTLDIECLKVRSNIVIQQIHYVKSIANPSDLPSRIQW